MVGKEQTNPAVAPSSPTRFGERPLDQTVEAAAVFRRLTGLLLSMEHPNATVDAMLVRLAEWERALSADAPGDNSPRLGPEHDDEARRIYLDHAFDIGSFNPSFPEYRFEQIDDEKACGRVTFPLAYEGPPGLVHGGFLAVLVDCVVQHHNCAIGRAGKTRALTVRYRRPTPLLTELRFEIERVVVERGTDSTVRLLHGEEVLCIGSVDAAGHRPDALAGTSFGKRRTVVQREEA